MCVVFSTMWLLCPKLVETSLSHFSRQSLQQVVLSSNFGRDVNNTNGATTEPTNHLPHNQKQNSQPNKDRNTQRKKNKRSTLQEMSTTSAEQPLNRPGNYLINKKTNQTNNGTNNRKQPNLKEMSTTPTERPPTWQPTPLENLIWREEMKQNNLKSHPLLLIIWKAGLHFSFDVLLSWTDQGSRAHKCIC